MSSKPFIATLMLLLSPALAVASGWQDYTLTIAPGFTIERMNSFQVCLAGAEELLLVCPKGEVGPIEEFAVTEDSIVTKNLGAKPAEGEPAKVQIDPAKEFFFLVRRADESITGPLTRVEWEKANLPNLSTLHWVRPSNPSFWTPLLGNLAFVGFIVSMVAIPVVLVVVIGLVFWRRGQRHRAREA
jgi:hypothetical protein